MELITKTELGRKIGISRQAVDKAVKAGKLRLVGEGRSAKVDFHDALTVAYMKDNSTSRQIAKQKKGEDVQSEEPVQEKVDFPGESVALRDEKLKMQTRKLKMEMAEKTGELIPREEVEKAFGLISASIMNYIFPLGDRMSSIIAGVFESTDQEKINETKLILDEEIGRSLTAIKKDITDSL